MKPIKNCTKANPMPKGGEKDETVDWFHHGQKLVHPVSPGVEGDPIDHKCDYCGLEFQSFRGKKMGPLNDKATVERIKTNLAQLRARGWKPENETD